MSFDALLKSAQERDDYWVEDAIISFTSQLYAIMERLNIPQTEFAKRAKVSQPYINRVFKGNDNFTIETMVKLSRAVGARLSIIVKETDRPAAAEERAEESEAEPEVVFTSHGMFSAISSATTKTMEWSQ